MPRPAEKKKKKKEKKKSEERIEESKGGTYFDPFLGVEVVVVADLVGWTWGISGRSFLPPVPPVVGGGGMGAHLVEAGEGGADLPDGRDGMDLMCDEESWGRSVERDRDAGRSIVGRWSAERDRTGYSCLSAAPWLLGRSVRDRQGGQTLQLRLVSIRGRCGGLGAALALDCVCVV
ncbi:unnamed protein product [Arctogadus glacialis]